MPGKFRVALGLLVGLALLLPAAPAGAHVTDIDIDNTAAFVGTQDIGVDGQHQCTDGHTWQLKVEVTQDEAVARGSDSGQCVAGVEQWQVVATTERGTFEPGNAHVCVRVGSFLQGEPHGSKKVCELVVIQSA